MSDQFSETPAERKVERNGSQDDANLIENFNTDQNIADQQRIKQLKREKARIELEYTKTAESLGVTPQPIPHVHKSHDEISRESRWAFIMATVGGLLVACALTLFAMTSHVLALLAATTFFLIAERLGKFGICVAFDLKAFIRHFKLLVIPGLITVAVSFSVILLGRVASASLADQLIDWTPYAWWAIEGSLLYFDALARVGYQRFGWSGFLTRDHEACLVEIKLLEQKVQRRSRGSGPSGTGSACLALFFLLTLGAAALKADTPAGSEQCTTIMDDRTGSVEHSDQIELELINSLAAKANRVPCTVLIFFSDDPFSAGSTVLRWRSTSRNLPYTLPLQRAADQKVQEAARTKLVDYFKSIRLPPAACTSLPDMLSRAARETKPVLLVTDAVHSCGPLHPEPLGSGSGVFVILVRSKTDQGSDEELFRRRRNLIHKFLPQALVARRFNVQQIVDCALAAMGSDPTKATAACQLLE